MRPIRRPMLALAAGVLLASGTQLAWAPVAEACMSARRVPVDRPGTPVGVIDQAGAKVLLAQDGDQVACHLQVQYYGDAKEFSMIVPAPAEPTVGVGSEALFTAMREATRPDFTLAQRTEGTCREPERASSGGGWFGGAPAPAAAPAKSKAGAPAPQVEVVSRSEVGPYDATVLRATDADALKTWLEANEYVVPAKLAGVMGDYVAAKAYFVAVKLQKDREAGEIQPLVLKYKAEKPGVPVRLSSVSAVPDMDVYMWVLGDTRAVPDNYDHVEINEARLDWLGNGRNYRQVVTEAMNEAGGRAWVTDFAGKSSAVKLPPELKRRAELDTISLAAKTNAADFMAHVREQKFFNEPEAQEAFFKRHVPGYANGSAADAAAAVDAGKAMDELQSTYIMPARDALRLFADHPYLTQLYTTVSPDEMTQDPTVVFTREMGDVSNHYKATAITMCSPAYLEHQAPVRILLPNGQSWLAEEGTMSTGGGGAGGGVKLPASRRVMRCGVGAPRTISDNFGDISRTLGNLFSQRLVLRIRTNAGATPRDGAGTTFVLSAAFESGSAAGSGGGFGCLGCAQTNTPPVQQGAGEGLAYALVFAGFLGYRRWLGR